MGFSGCGRPSWGLLGLFEGDVEGVEDDAAGKIRPKITPELGAG